MFAMGPAFFKAAAGYATLTLTGTYPAAVVGVPYSQTLAIAGGLSPYSLTGGTGVASGSLPAGLALSIVGSTLVLSGTPTTAATATFTASVDSTDSQTATSPQSIVVSAAAKTYDRLSTWDSNNSIILTNNDLTVGTANGTSGPWAAIRSVLSKSAGKSYFEIKNEVMGGTTGDAMWGFMKASDSLASYPGSSSQSAASMGWQANNPTNSAKFQSGSLGSVSGYGTLAAGGYSYFAIDYDAGKMWVKNSSASGWAGGGDPASGTTPTFTFTANTALLAAIAAYAKPQSATANFGASAFNGTVPTGFDAGRYTTDPDIAALNLAATATEYATTSVNDAQSICTDGTNIWFSNSTTIFKYDMVGTLITSRNVSGDDPTSKQQINGLAISGGVLYVLAASYVSGVATSWVMTYDPTTLAWGTTTLISSTKFAEGLALKGGYWWVVYHADMVCSKFDLTWTLVTDYTLPFTITGSSGGYGSGHGYDGVAWVGDYLLCNIHETYDQKYTDMYYFDGTNFNKFDRIHHVTTTATQGMCVDPTNPHNIWFAERIVAGDKYILAAF